MKQSGQCPLSPRGLASLKSLDSQDGSGLSRDMGAGDEDQTVFSLDVDGTRGHRDTGT